MDTKVLTAHVPLPLAEKVDQIAGRLVKQALIAWVDQEEKRHLMNVEAFADVDNGQVIDHASVKAWADSVDTDKPLPMPR